MISKQLFGIAIGLVVSVSAMAADWKEALVNQAICKYQALEEYNNANDKRGQSALNEYVIELNPDWIEERPNKLITESNYNSLANILRDFNNQRSDKLRFYIIIVNDYKARLDETVDITKLPDRVDNLDGLVNVVDSRIQYERFKNEIATIPQEISHALLSKGFGERVVYFYGRISLFKLDRAPRVYKWDRLFLDGGRLDLKRDEIISHAKSGLGTDAAGKKIERIATNVINSLQLVIDGNGGGTPLVDCSQNFDEIIKNTASIREREYESVVKSMSALLDYPLSPQQIKSRYVLFSDPDDLNEEDHFNSQVLPERLNLLAEYSAYRMYVLFKAVNFGIAPGDWQKLAKEVFEKSEIAKRSNTIIVVVPYLKTYCTDKNIFGSGGATGTGLIMPSAFCSDTEMSDKINSAISLKGSTWEARLCHALTHVPKKHILLQYAVSYDFITKRYTTTVTEGTGLDKIFELQILVDGRLQKHVDALVAIERAMDSKEPSISTLETNRAILKSLPSESGTPYRLSHGIREKVLAKAAFSGLGPDIFSEDAEQFVRWFVTKKAQDAKSIAWGSVVHWFDDSTDSPTDDVFIKGVNPVVLENTFSSLDVAGVALNFTGLDWIADGAGLLIASYYRDTENKIVYGASLAIPVSALIIRTVAKRAKLLRKTLGGQWELVDDVVDEVTELLNSIRKNVPDEHWEKFYADFGQNSEMLRKFDAEPGLVGAWKALDASGVDDIVRKNPVWIDRVSGWHRNGVEIGPEGKLLIEGKQVGQIVGDRLHINYNGYGGEIICDPDGTTTIIGKWHDPNCGGTCDVIDSRLSKSGENSGGANVLSADAPADWTPDEVWRKINEPWLREAVNRGDVIRVVSDPINMKNVFANIEGIPSGVFSSPENLAKYLKNLKDVSTIDKLSFYGKEIKYLSENNYVFNPSTKTFLK